MIEDNNIINPNTLLEARMITDQQYNMIIEVNPSENFPNFFRDPYFKLYYNSNYKANNGKCSRISIKEPRFVNHNGSIMSINSREVGFLIALLKRDYSNTETVWQHMCKYITDLAQERHIDVDYTKLKMPDYTQLKFR